jgi:putative serine protease PepD
VTDGWNWRQPQPPTPSGQSTAGSPWWSDALTDPWRDPYAPAAVVVPTAPVSEGPPTEPVTDPDAPRRGLGPILVICLVTALLAGGLGGTLGYVFAVRGGVGTKTTLGAQPAVVPSAANRAPDSLAGVAKKVLPSVVTVRITGALGSGIIISADGYVLTNDHVIDGNDGQISVVFNDGSTASAKLVGRDQESDVAVIKVAKTGLTPITFGNSDQVAVGDPVLAFGSPLALTNTVTEGIVSALDRTIESGETGGTTRYYRAIQTDAAVNQGNSGGPLVDAAGQIVGMNSVIRSLSPTDATAGNIGIAFAIPFNQARRLAEDIIKSGKAPRTVIGADVDSSDSTVGSTGGAGAKLQSVQSGGPAAVAGLKAGDVITKLDGHLLEDGIDLIALVRSYAPDTVVPLQYRRGTKSLTASVTLAADAN